MAKKPAKKGRTVNVDFEGVETGKGGGVHIPEGEYAMKVKSAEMDESESGNEMIAWQFTGTEGKAKGKTFYFYTPIVEQALWKLRETLEALGVEVPDSAMDIDLDELEGLEATGIVEDDEYKGKTKSRLVGLVGEGGSEEDDDDGEDDKKPAKKANGKSKKVVKVSAEEVQAMDEDELETLNDKHDLGVDLGDFKILRKKAAAIIAALEENDLLEEA